VTLETHPRGGHLGFVAGPYLPRFWAESRVAEFLAAYL
jgi:predicted alpha/beta-fold hydrolase